MGLTPKHTLFRGSKTPRKVTPLKPSPTTKTIPIKAGSTTAKRESVLLPQPPQSQHVPRRKSRSYRYYTPLVLVVVVGLYVANPKDQIHPWLSSPFSQTSSSTTNPIAPSTNSNNNPRNGRVIQLLPIPRTLRKMGMMTPPSQTLAHVRTNSGYSWIHQRAELIDWDTIQTSYQDIIRQIQSKTALVANHTKTVVHEVTGIVAVATIVLVRSIGSLSHNCLESSHRIMNQINRSTQVVRTGSIHRVESLVSTVGSKTRQWWNVLPPLIVPNTRGTPSSFQFLPTSPTTSDAEMTRDLLPVPTPPRSSQPHLRSPAISTTATTTTTTTTTTPTTRSSGKVLAPSVPPSRLREEYSFPTIPSRPGPSAKEEEAAAVITSPQTLPPPPPATSPPAVQHPILPSIMILRSSLSSSPQQHFQKWVEKIQQANIATFHFEQQRTKLQKPTK